MWKKKKKNWLENLSLLKFFSQSFSSMKKGKKKKNHNHHHQFKTSITTAKSTTSRNFICLFYLYIYIFNPERKIATANVQNSNNLKSANPQQLQKIPTTRCHCCKCSLHKRSRREWKEKLWLIGGKTDWEHDCDRLLHSSNKEDGGKDSLEEYENDKEEGRRQHRWRKSCSLLCNNASTEPIIAFLHQSKYSDLSLHPFDLPNPPHCCYPPSVDDVEGERGMNEWKKYIFMACIVIWEQKTRRENTQKILKFFGVCTVKMSNHF